MINYVSLHEFIIELFNNPPKSDYIYNIDINEIAAEQDLTTFQVLMYILIEGAKILFGPDISPQIMSMEQLELLKLYMSSIGYILRHNFSYKEDHIKMINIWFEPIINIPNHRFF